MIESTGSAVDRNLEVGEEEHISTTMKKFEYVKHE